VRHAFLDGRFSMELPIATPPVFTSVKEEDKTTWTFQSAGTGFDLTMYLIESNFDDPTDDADAGMRAYIIKGQLDATGGTEKERRDVKLEGLGVEATVATIGISGSSPATERLAVFGADTHTVALFYVDEKGVDLGASTFEKMLHSIKAEKPTPVKPKKNGAVSDSEEYASIVAALTQKRGESSAEDVAAQPKSRKTGEPSVANSCHLAIVSQCYETAFSSVGKGYYSDKDKCSNGVLSDGPCPAEKRSGFCMLEGGHQLVSLYQGALESPEESLASSQALCATFNGEWLGLPAQRPWPKN